MILERISILNYKNIEQVELAFSPKLNCFLGNNGMGKTNLLDAIYYLSFCKSHNNMVDTQNIRHDSDFALIQGYYINDERTETDEYLCSIRRRQRKQFKRNKKEYDKLSDHIGYLPLVLVSPSDSDLITGRSEERRKFIDVVLSQFDKGYLHSLIRYNKALQQRNALLKSEIGDTSLYELWEDRLVDEGQIIYDKRKSFVEEFIPTFQYYYNFICQSNETVDLNYESQLSDSNLRDLLTQRRDKDRILGYSTVGVHRDDLDMKLDDYSMKKVGSQGQNKTYVIAMKLAQFDFLKQAGSTVPVMLLDDIFDKLDSSRVEQIVKLVSGENFGQIFITDTNKDHLDEILKNIDSDYCLYQVQRGEVAVI